MTHVLEAALWIWIGGAAVLIHIVLLTLGDEGEPRPAATDVLVCLTWPLYFAIDWINRLRERRP